MRSQTAVQRAFPRKRMRKEPRKTFSKLPEPNRTAGTEAQDQADERRPLKAGPGTRSRPHEAGFGSSLAGSLDSCLSPLLVLLHLGPLETRSPGTRPRPHRNGAKMTKGRPAGQTKSPGTRPELRRNSLKETRTPTTANAKGTLGTLQKKTFWAEILMLSRQERQRGDRRRAVDRPIRGRKSHVHGGQS